MDNRQNSEQAPQGKNKKTLLMWLGILLGVLVLIYMLSVPGKVLGGEEQEVSYDTFLKHLEEGKIEKVDLKSETILYKLKTEALPTQAPTATFAPGQEGTFFGFRTLGGSYSPIDYVKKEPASPTYSTIRLDDEGLVERLLTAGVSFGGVKEEGSVFLYLLLQFAPMLLLVLFYMFLFRRIGAMNRGGGIMGLGKSNARSIDGGKIQTTFRDVAGQEEAKESLQEIVAYLHDPKKYKEIGAKMPRGVLLYGPPGTGKTLLARAVAGEAGVPFLSIAGSEFVEMIVGLGASKVRDLFKQARTQAPCIVFIDEMDTVGKKRGANFGGNDEQEQTLNQLLAEMDGFEENSGVIVLAATNRPDSLDKALLRPGRFDRRVPVELPDQGGREAILGIHANKVKKAEKLDLAAIARITPGASGADLANVINEAALLAVKNGHNGVTQQDLEDSVDTALAGKQRKSMVISQKEKEIVAFHEVGHAIVSACQKHAAPVHKITIIPRTGGALGFTMQADEGERFLLSREEAFAKLMTLAGGRAAESLIFGSITTGAGNDISEATKLARAMIARYGMNDKLGFVAFEEENNPYLYGESGLRCASETAAMIDKEVIALVEQAYNETYALLSKNEPRLRAIAKELMEQETMDGECFMQLMAQYAPALPEEAVETAPIEA